MLGTEGAYAFACILLEVSGASFCSFPEIGCAYYLILFHPGNGSYEDGLKAGMNTAHSMLGRRFTFLRNPKQMVPSWTEAALRHYVIRFFKHFISASCLTLLQKVTWALQMHLSMETFHLLTRIKVF